MLGFSCFTSTIVVTSSLGLGRSTRTTAYLASGAVIPSYVRLTLPTRILTTTSRITLTHTFIFTGGRFGVTYITRITRALSNRASIVITA